MSSVIGLINGQILTVTRFSKYFGSNSNGNVKQLPSTNVTISPTSDVVVVTIIFLPKKNSSLVYALANGSSRTNV